MPLRLWWTIGGATRRGRLPPPTACCPAPPSSASRKACIKELFFLNTIPASEDALKCSKIKYVNVADVFAEAISRIFNETSVSPLFQ